jgi:acyl carrier protein
MNNQLDDIVARVLAIPAEDVTEDLGPRIAAQWTSLKHVQLIAALEDAYNIKFTPREIRSARSVSTLRGLIQNKVGEV